jgi:hypothetical protein
MGGGGGGKKIGTMLIIALGAQGMLQKKDDIKLKSLKLFQFAKKTLLLS